METRRWRDAKAALAGEAGYCATYTPAQLQAAEAHPASAWSETKGWTLFAQGRADAALALMRPLADTQDRVGKGEVEPPAREMMADMLRLAGRLGEALAQYKLSLRIDPGSLQHPEARGRNSRRSWRTLISAERPWPTSAYRRNATCGDDRLRSTYRQGPALSINSGRPPPHHAASVLSAYSLQSVRGWRSPPSGSVH